MLLVPPISATPLKVLTAQALPVPGNDSERDVPLMITVFC